MNIPKIVITPKQTAIIEKTFPVIDRPRPLLSRNPIDISFKSLLAYIHVTNPRMPPTRHPEVKKLIMPSVKIVLPRWCFTPMYAGLDMPCGIPTPDGGTNDGFEAFCMDGVDDAANPDECCGIWAAVGCGLVGSRFDAWIFFEGRFLELPGNTVGESTAITKGSDTIGFMSSGFALNRSRVFRISANSSLVD